MRKKLSNGEGVGGKGRLASVRIDIFQHFYGLVFKLNKVISECMSTVTLATLYHYMEQVNHECCPKGKNSC